MAPLYDDDDDRDEQARQRQKTYNYFGQPVDVALLAPRQGLPATGAPPPKPPEPAGPDFSQRPTMVPPRSADPTRSNLPSLAQEQGLGFSEIGKIATKVFETANQVRGLFPSDPAMTPEVRAAFEAQRAGERVGAAAGEALPVGIAESGTFTTGPTFADVPLDFGEYSALFAPGADVEIPLLAGEVFAPPALGELAGQAVGPAVGELAGEFGGALGAAEAFTPAVGELAGEAAAIGAGEAGAGIGIGSKIAGASFGQIAGVASSVAGVATSALAAAQAEEDYQKALHATSAALFAASLAVPPLAIVAGIIELGLFLEGLFGGPSEEWLSFGPRLQENLETTRVAMEQLTNDIESATSEEQLAAVIGKYRDTIGTYAGGFGKDAGPLDLPVPPGATGTEHESGLMANWEEATKALEALRNLRLESFQSAEEAAAAQQQATTATQAAPTRVPTVPWRQQAGVPLTYGEELPA